MPLNWVLSVFMIFFIFIVLCFVYYIKNNESFSIDSLLKFKVLLLGNNIKNINYLW